MNDDLPGLSDELADLLAAERDRGPASKEDAEAVLERVTAALGDPPGGGGHTPGGQTPAEGQSASRGSGSAARGLVDLARSRAGALALGAFVAGAAGGAWLRGVVDPKVAIASRSTPAVSVAPVVPSPPVAASGLPVAVLPDLVEGVPKPSSSAALPATPSPARRAPRSALGEIDEGKLGASLSTSPKDTRLAAERALVETGRTALARGDHTSAIAALERHASAFADGQLAEEREVLFVRALVAAGRVKEAAQRGARFRLAYPDSVMLPVVDEALR